APRSPILSASSNRCGREKALYPLPLLARGESERRGDAYTPSPRLRGEGEAHRDRDGRVRGVPEMTTFRALMLHEEGGKVAPRLESIDEAGLPPGEVTVAVEYSTLNYKDGTILQRIGRLVRQYPHVPGIDFAGTVERSDSPGFKPGDPVILTGWRVGEV